MDLQTRLETLLGPRDRNTVLLAIATPIILYTTTRLLSRATSGLNNRTGRIIAAPRQSLQLLSAADPSEIPYPSDALPGARDVDTPYGNIRVYEWGPANGRKVLFVHGISTPCIAFAGVAKQLAEKGCRVLLFDLFGRGYSDTPDPDVCHQDIQLWTSQILLVLASSEVAWGRADRFTVIGYSMGGGISAAFTSYFPEMVDSLILVAPGGLIRASQFSVASKLLYGGWLPSSLVSYYVYHRLKDGAALPQRAAKSKSIAPAQVAESEVPGHPALAADSNASIFPGRPGISPKETVRWQIDAHPGFLAAFISSIKHAPVAGEHERWRRIGSRQSAQRASEEPGKAPGLKEGKVLILLGETDKVIVTDEIEPDAIEAFREENVKVVRLAGGHDLPIVNADGCVKAIEKFWNGE